MANLHSYTVQESNNLIIPRLVEVTLTMSASDNDDNDVAFNWATISNASLRNGEATKLVSAVLYDPGVSLPTDYELFFCRGGDAAGSIPGASLRIGAADTAPDISAAEASAIFVCGSLALTQDHAESLTTAGVTTAKDINLIMSPASSSTDLHVAGVYRSNPADNSGGNTSATLYLGFEG
jgi:hypothetical protein